MKQALVRHTDFLARGGGGVWETGVPVYKTIECLQVTFCLFTSFPSILRQTSQYLNCWFFSTTALNKAKGLVSIVTQCLFKDFGPRPRYWIDPLIA